MESFLHDILRTFRKNACNRRRLLRAFTLLELIVSVSIIGVILAVALLGQTNFNRTLILTDTAYTVALSIRQMQSYGLSSVYFNTYNNAGFGVHFNRATASKTYYEFADINKTAAAPSYCPSNQGLSNTPEQKPGNCLYDGTSELVPGGTFSLTKNYSISDICGIPLGTATPVCSSQNSNTGIIDIVYIRPNMQSVMTGIFNGSSKQLSTACIKILAPDHVKYRWVKVSFLGQVTVTSDATCTP